MTKDDVEIESGKLTIEYLIPCGRTRRTYEDLQNGRTHPAPCCCPSCFYHLYISCPRQRGRAFDKEAFLLEELYYWARISRINIWYGYHFTQNGPSKTEKIVRYDLPDYFGARGALMILVDYIKRNFPEIDPDPRRIKLKLWRIRKSGIIHELEHARMRQANPPSSDYDEAWKVLRFAQKVAEFVGSRPGRKATQREILRRFSNKRIEDLERIHKVEDGQVVLSLLANFGIISKRRRKSRLFISTRRK